MFDFIPPEILSGLLKALRYVYLTSPLWLPVVFIGMLFNAWVYYIRSKYWQKLGSVILEVKLPKEIFKSPAAMEVVLSAMHQTADEGNWYQKYWLGQTRSWFSLELVSMGGNIRFFIWMRKKYRNSIEGHLYSQYPGIEVYEVEDYTKEFYFNPERQKMFGLEWKLDKPDPYPIKTYVDYGLDKDPKEEFKVDPMSTSLEFLSTVTPGHNVWMQIIIRAHKKEQKKGLTWAQRWEKLEWSETIDSWKDESRKEIDKIIEKLKVAKEEGGFPRIPTKGEAETIAALERSVSKIGFDVGIRSMYFADKDEFNGMYVAGIFGYFKQYASGDLNGFKSSGWYSEFSNPVMDWWKSDKEFPYWLFDEYKLRRYFFSPHMGKWYYSKPFILNSEELATIYHFPGSTAAAPTFGRVPSKKSEAPSNLPV
jgi:hypothetical protein